MIQITPTNPINASEGTDFQLVEANIRFLKKNSGIRKISPKNGEFKTVNIHCYSDVTKLRNDFSIHKNGLQYCALETDLLLSINQFVKSPFLKKNRSNVLSCANQFLSSWGRENGIQGTAVPININYRTANPEDKATAPFFYAHADYDEHDIANTMQTNKYVWKANIETVTGPLSEEKYQNLKINTIVNLWMPLNELPTVNTLAVMDTGSVENLSEQLQPALTPGKERDITSLGLNANMNQKWVVQTMMTRGSGVIFYTMKTPHTAIDIESRFQGQECDPFRESLEVRVAYIELPN